MKDRMWYSCTKCKWQSISGEFCTNIELTYLRKQYPLLCKVVNRRGDCEYFKPPWWRLWYRLKRWFKRKKGE